MTDLLTENARLRAALDEIAGARFDKFKITARAKMESGQTATACDGHYYCEAAPVEALVSIARAALATPAPDAVQEAARVERVACAMWKAEADRAAPNVGRNRTPEMFANELHDTRAKWLGLADAALRAIAGDRT